MFIQVKFCADSNTQKEIFEIEENALYNESTDKLKNKVKEKLEKIGFKYISDISIKLVKIEKL